MMVSHCSCQERDSDDLVRVSPLARTDPGCSGPLTVCAHRPFPTYALLASSRTALTPAWAALALQAEVSAFRSAVRSALVTSCRARGNLLNPGSSAIPVTADILMHSPGLAPRSAPPPFHPPSH